MIWYSDKIGCKDLEAVDREMEGEYYNLDSYPCPQSGIELVGEYNYPGTDNNIIEIYLTITPSLKLLLFHDNPSFLITPDDYLDPDIIKQKYYKKLIKFRNIISKLTLPQIIQKYK